MDLELSADQRDLAAIARELLDRHAPLALARDCLDGGGDRTALWRAVADVGWYAVGTDDDDPFGLPGLCLLAREWGSHVAPGPLVDTAMAVRLARTLDAARGGDRLVAALAAGEASAALAVLEDGIDWTFAGMEASASADGDAHVLNAAKIGVAHGGEVDAFVVHADVHGEPAWLIVPAGAAGVDVQPEPGLDPSTAPASATFADIRVPAARALVGRGAAVDRVLAAGAIATAAEGLGAASQALDLAVRYALERRQFGRVIASFQALQHLLADAHVLRETAWSTILYAAAALDEEMAEAFELASIAKAHASRASREVVEVALQAFGGVAFTWEHDAHLLQRRVLECERRWGDAVEHERRLSDLLAPMPAEAGAGA